MIYRNLLFADQIPDEVDPGLPQLTPEWTWVAVDGPRVYGVLCAFAQHGMFWLARARVARKAPKTVFRGLVRKALQDARARGFSAFMCWLMNEREEERRIYRLLDRRGTTWCYEGDSMLVAGEIESILKPGSQRVRIGAPELRKAV